MIHCRTLIAGTPSVFRSSVCPVVTVVRSPRRCPEMILTCRSFCFHRQAYTLRTGNRYSSSFQSVVRSEASGGSRRPALSTQLLCPQQFHRQAVRVDCMDWVLEYFAGIRNLLGIDTLPDSDSRYSSFIPVTCLHRNHGGAVPPGAVLRYALSAVDSALTGKSISYVSATGVLLASSPLFTRKHQAEVDTPRCPHTCFTCCGFTDKR